MESYKDTDLMPYGKHVGTKLANVPASYLQWLWENTLSNSVIHMSLTNKKLRQYYIDNKDVIEKELKEK